MVLLLKKYSFLYYFFCIAHVIFCILICLLLHLIIVISLITLLIGKFCEFSVIATEPFHKFAIPIKSEEHEPESNNGLACRLEFTYTEKYPEEPLIINIEDTENFEDGNDEELHAHLVEQMNENLGIVMVFTLVSAAQEWLNVQWDKVKLHREENAALKLKEEEEAELVKKILKIIFNFSFTINNY